MRKKSKKKGARTTGRELEALLRGIKQRKDVMAGTLSAAYLPCNKGNCRCTRGYLHGPTWRISYKDQGKSSTVYVRREELVEVKAAVERYAQLRTAVQHAGMQNLQAFVKRAKRRRRSDQQLLKAHKGVSR